MTVEVSLTGKRNKERFLSEILKERKGQRLEDVVLTDESLELIFSDKKNTIGKTIVKQYSKLKYKAEAIACFKNFSYVYVVNCQKNILVKMGRVIKVIELPDVWLAFFEK